MVKGKVEPLTDDDVRAVLGVAMVNLRDYLIIRLLAKTGMRIGELTRMKTSDIDFKNNVLYIPIAKWDSAREVPFDTVTKSVLSLYISEKKIDGQLWQIGDRAIQNMIKKYARLAGISKNVSPHSFRHYFGTTLIRNGLDPHKVKGLMGHRSISTTDIYVHIPPRVVMASYEKIMGGW